MQELDAKEKDCAALLEPAAVDNSTVKMLPTRRKRRNRAGRRRPSECRSQHQKAHAAFSHPEAQQQRPGFTANCLEQLQSDAEERHVAAIAQLHGMVISMAFHSRGCRVIQLAFEVADRIDLEALVLELHGHVRDAVTSPHANHVVQKAVTMLPSAKTAFVPEELLGMAAWTAKHKFGCRIMCRIVEHPGSEQRNTLIAEMLDEAGELCQSFYGRHVIASIFEHGTVQQRKRVVSALCSGGLLCYAMNQHGSHVLEEALASADIDDQDLLMAELLRDPDIFLSMADNQYGRHVVKALIRHRGKFSEIAFAYVRNAAKHLEGTKFGRRLLEDVDLLP